MDAKRKGRLASGVIVLGIVLGGVLIALSLHSVAGGGLGIGSQGSQAKDPRGLGPRDAKVQMIVYFDFQCGHCERLHSTAEAQIVKDYVANGKVHLEARPVPFLGPESQRAAEAALCAADQGKFWEYREALFATWRSNGPATYSPQGLSEIARRVGLDRDKLAACVNEGAKRGELAEIYRQAQSDGVRSVPAVLINGKVIVGNQPYAQFAQAIEAELSR